MNVGERVTVVFDTGGKVITSRITYADEEKSCGYVRLSPKIHFERKGTIIGYKSGWFNDYWLVGLDEGSIVRIPA